MPTLHSGAVGLSAIIVPDVANFLNRQPALQLLTTCCGLIVEDAIRVMETELVLLARMQSGLHICAASTRAQETSITQGRPCFASQPPRPCCSRRTESLLALSNVENTDFFKSSFSVTASTMKSAARTP